MCNGIFQNRLVYCVLFKQQSPNPLISRVLHSKVFAKQWIVLFSSPFLTRYESNAIQFTTTMYNSTKKRDNVKGSITLRLFYSHPIYFSLPYMLLLKIFNIKVFSKIFVVLSIMVQINSANMQTIHLKSIKLSIYTAFITIYNNCIVSLVLYF